MHNLLKLEHLVDYDTLCLTRLLNLVLLHRRSLHHSTLTNKCVKLISGKLNII